MRWRYGSQATASAQSSSSGSELRAANCERMLVMQLSSVVSRLAAFLSRSGAGKWRVPDDTRVYAIGDIHGRADLLQALHARILADVAEGAPDTVVVVYIGDYVDRGLQSREVIDLLLSSPLDGFENVYLKGNHDAWLLGFLEDAADGADWLACGGQATLYSYRIAQPELALGRGLNDVRCELRRAIPETHLRFLLALRSWHLLGDYLFVHAGIRPGLALEEQTEADLLWIRDDFLNCDEDHGKMVVHGHTVTDRPDVRFNRIGIDTGGFATNRLTCLVLEQAERRFLE